MFSFPPLTILYVHFREREYYLFILFICVYLFIYLFIRIFIHFSLRHTHFYDELSGLSCALAVCSGNFCQKIAPQAGQEKAEKMQSPDICNSGSHYFSARQKRKETNE
jgi:hypothetical protein